MTSPEFRPDTGFGIDPPTWLDQRLRQSLQRSGSPDPAALATISRRLSNGQTRPDVAPAPIRYRLVLMAAFAVVAVAVLWPQIVGTQSSTQTTGPASPPVQPPPVPTFWYLWPIAGIVFAFLAATRRYVTDRLVFWAAAAFSLGALALTFMTLPMVRIGALGLQQAPVVEGYELVDLDLHYWPDLYGERLASLTYVPDGRSDPLVLNPDNPDQRRQSDHLGFVDYSDGGRGHCLQFGTWPDAWPWEGDYFCIESATTDQLVLNVDSTRGPDRLLARFVGFSLMALGVVYAVLAAGRRRRVKLWSTRQDLAFGAAVTCMAVGVFVAGFMASNIVRSTQADLSGITSDSRGFHQQIWERLEAADVHEPAYWVYTVVIAMADVLAMILVAVGWALASTVFTGPKQSWNARLRVCIALSLLLLVVFVVQFTFYPSVSILDWYNE